MLSQHRNAAGEALLALGIWNGDRSLMLPRPTGRRIFHWKRIELARLTVLLPVAGKHAVLVRVMD